MRNLLLASLLCACGSHASDPSVPHAPPATLDKFPVGPPLVTPGERMSYRLSLEGMDLATYDFAVGDVTEVAGRKAVVVQSHAKAAGLVKVVANIDDTFTSWLDVTTGRPLRWSTDEFATKSTDKERTDVMLYPREGNTIPIEFHLNNDTPEPEPQTVSMADVWDFNSFLIALRSWEDKPGSSLDAEVLRSRYLWHVATKIHGREKLVTELGELPALRFDGETYKLSRDGKRRTDTEPRQFSVWISDDDGRVPLQTVAKTDYGDITMTLVDYQPGNGQRLRP